MTARPTPPPPALLLAARAGNPAAVDAWFRAEHPHVWRLCLGFLADPEEAEDLAQDAMLRLLDRLDRWDPERPYAPWRTALVLNLCRDRQRRLGTRRDAEDEAAEQGLPARLPRPDAVAEQKELRGLLQRALAHLSPREREAFVLRDLEGVETAEVAAAMGVEAASVRSLLTLARRRLRGLLGEHLAPTAEVEG